MVSYKADIDLDDDEDERYEDESQPPEPDEPQLRRKPSRDEYLPLMQKLAEIGGGRFRPEDDIVQRGQQLVLPENMSMHKAAQFLMRRIKADEDETVFRHRYKYRPFDGAVCTWRGLKRAFGMVGLEKRTEQGFFGPVKVNTQMFDVPVGPNETESVPWGAFTLPSFSGTVFTPQMWTDEEMGPLFELVVEGPRKYRSHVEGIFRLVQEELEQRSIYRGGAFDGQVMPEFLDLTGVSPDRVVYSPETMVQLDANIWSVLRYREQLQRAGITRKRSALLYGPYGTGKTLGGFLTAQVAVQSGWTFIYARPGKDDMQLVMQTARLYQPACVFFEDLDTVANPESTSADGATRLLDVFDGITAKGTELLVVLTTNHPDRIHRGMLRPGRLDAVIEIGALDQDGVQKLITTTLPPEALAMGIDWGAVFDAAKGMFPAYVKEVADRAYRYALSRTGEPEKIKLQEGDLIHAANGLQPQLALMEAANDPRTPDPLSEVVARTVQKSVAESLIEDVVRDDVLEAVSKETNGARR